MTALRGLYTKVKSVTLDLLPDQCVLSFLCCMGNPSKAESPYGQSQPDVPQIITQLQSSQNPSEALAPISGDKLHETQKNVFKFLFMYPFTSPQVPTDVHNLPIPCFISSLSSNFFLKLPRKGVGREVRRREEGKLTLLRASMFQTLKWHLTLTWEVYLSRVSKVATTTQDVFSVFCSLKVLLGSTANQLI